MTGPPLLTAAAAVAVVLVLTLSAIAGSRFAIGLLPIKRAVEHGARHRVEHVRLGSRRNKTLGRDRKADAPGQTSIPGGLGSANSPMDDWRWGGRNSEYEIVDAMSSQAAAYLPGQDGEGAVALRQQTIAPIHVYTEYTAAEKPIPFEAAATTAEKLSAEAEECVCILLLPRSVAEECVCILLLPRSVAEDTHTACPHI